MSSAQPPVSPESTAAARCKNCETVLVGRFCVNCGQAAGVHVPSTQELMHELLEGLTHSDSRLWRSLKTLWFKPGRLTQEFVAGRRMAYLPPFRLYLVLSVILFLIAPLSHTQVEFIHFDQPTATNKNTLSSCQDVNFPFLLSHPGWNERVRHSCEQTVRDHGVGLFHGALAAMPKAMFLFLPLIAALNMLFYWRPRYRYAEQLLFFVHLHAFLFSAIIVMILADAVADAWTAMAPAAGVIEFLMGWSMPVYTFIALRRVFTKSWTGAFFKSVALYFTYMIVFGLTVSAVFVYAMLQL